MKDVIHGYSYFPVLIDGEKYGMSRDALYEKLKKKNIFARRYFYPLISTFEPYCKLPSANADNLPIAIEYANKVLCLPLYPDLEFSDVQSICSIMRARV